MGEAKKKYVTTYVIISATCDIALLPCHPSPVSDLVGMWRHCTYMYTPIMGVYIMGVYIMGVYIMGVYIMGVYIMGVHIMAW